MTALGARKHLLLTKADQRRLPALYSTDGADEIDRRIPVKFFSPFSGFRWYILEGETCDGGTDVRFFAWVTSPLCPDGEYGFVQLSELSDQYAGALPLVERDKWWDRTTTLADVRAGIAA